MGFEAFYVLMPVCLILSAIGLGMFLWALHSGQLDDLETPAMRILFEDDSPRAPVQEPAAGGSTPAVESPGTPRAK
jgi:cbb3-type cytochrome oxidase maturation protein